MEGIVGVLGVIMLVLCLVGTIGYNGLRRKWAGIIRRGGILCHPAGGHAAVWDYRHLG